MTERRDAVYMDKYIYLECVCAYVIALSLSLCFSYQNDGGFTMTTMISRATSIRMNTEESITVPIGGADRQESVARSRFASAVRGIEIIIIGWTILIARQMG